MNPEYPVYIISKARWQRRPTSKALDRMNVPYHIVVEPSEYEQYAQEIDKDKIYVLPFENLGQGSIPARNWVWEHAVTIGSTKHWILDDNIYSFMRLNHNRHYDVDSGVTFKCIEDFVDRYENIAIAGMNYNGLVKQRDGVSPFYLNTRIYSCILLRNDLPYRWRGRYNEDTDLSLRVLKDGWCTVLFNAFTAGKETTMRMKGGNTDELYKEDGRLKMAQSLAEQHPDLVEITWKFGRWQHSVNYRVFKKNKLIPKNDFQKKSGINNYGMTLIKGNLFEK